MEDDGVGSSESPLACLDMAAYSARTLNGGVALPCCFSLCLVSVVWDLSSRVGAHCPILSERSISDKEKGLHCASMHHPSTFLL
jgi:hypothetical protein